jgi:hypothetical protein
MARHSLELRHIDLFQEKGYVLFHDLISKQKTLECQHILSSLSTASTRNLWRHHPVLKNLYFNYQLSHLASQLTNIKLLRFGFDHCFLSLPTLSSFFSKDHSLTELTSLDGLEIALILTTSSLKEPGSGLFFNPNCVIDIPSLFHELSMEGPFLLVTYCKANARYIYKPLDPFTHDVKKESCAFGDLISNEHHPLVHY